MRVLVISGELIASSICHKLLAEGHDVKLYIEQEGWKECLDGLVPKTDDWRTDLGWVGHDGLIIFDDIGFGKEQEELRKQGFKVVGGSVGGDELESNRELFHNLLSDCGIPTLPSFDFSSPDEAIEYIKKYPDEWVVKQNAHFGVLNYVGQRLDGNDAINALKSYKSYDIQSTHLQKRAHGVEIGVARYFNGEDWVGPIEINHEHKRLCNDDLGPLTHEMGTIIWYSDNEELPLFSKTLSKLKSHLQEIDFRGDIDINCIVNEEGIWPLEATSRFGNPSTPLQCELNNSSWADFLSAIATKSQYSLKYKKSFGIVISLAIPPFPYLPMFGEHKSAHNRNENVVLNFKEGISTEDMTHIHFEEISVSGSPGEEVYHWAGTDGWVMHVTAEDKDISKAQEKAYAIIDKIILPNVFYRTDIGTRVKNKDLPLLHEWGYI